MRHSPYIVATAFLLTAACREDAVPTAPQTPIAAVDQETAALESDSWASLVDMPTGRGHLTAAAVNGVVYAIGGLLHSEEKPTDKVESYHPNTTTLIPWRAKAPMPEPRAATNGAAVINGKIYVSGGYELDEEGHLRRTRTLFRYNPSTDSWSTRALLPRASVRGATVAIDGKLYVYVPYGPDNVGGAALYRYDPSTNKWTERKAPPSVQTDAAATALGGKMYIIGGRTGKTSPTNKVIVYNPATDRWSTRAPLLTPRTGPVARTIDGRIYVAGGASEGPVELPAAVEVYDPGSDAWTLKAGMPTPRAAAAAAAAGGKLYVIGGNDEDGRTAEVYMP